jgi:hypothetical protein
MIDQVMKNASCHDKKMEAYCNAVRTLEEKFYGIKLNHAPRKYNEEVDELAKIASGRITVPLNVFARDVAKPFVDLGSAPSNQEEPSGAPSNPAGVELMDEDPSNEAFVLSMLEGYGTDEAETMETESAPHAEDWRAKYLAWIDRRELPPDQSEARRIARMAKLFTTSTTSCTARRVWHPAAVHPHPPCSRAYSRHPCGRVWPPRSTIHPHGQCIPPRLLLAHLGRKRQ